MEGIRAPLLLQGLVCALLGNSTECAPRGGRFCPPPRRNSQTSDRSKAIEAAIESLNECF